MVPGLFRAAVGRGFVMTLHRPMSGTLIRSINESSTCIARRLCKCITMKIVVIVRDNLLHGDYYQCIDARRECMIRSIE